MPMPPLISVSKGMHFFFFHSKVSFLSLLQRYSSIHGCVINVIPISEQDKILFNGQMTPAQKDGPLKVTQHLEDNQDVDYI